MHTLNSLIEMQRMAKATKETQRDKHQGSTFAVSPHGSWSWNGHPCDKGYVIGRLGLAYQMRVINAEGGVVTETAATVEVFREHSGQALGPRNFEIYNHDGELIATFNGKTPVVALLSFIDELR